MRVPFFIYREREILLIKSDTKGLLPPPFFSSLFKLTNFRVSVSKRRVFSKVKEKCGGGGPLDSIILSACVDDDQNDDDARI